MLKDDAITDDVDGDVDDELDPKKKKVADGDVSLDELADDELEEPEDSFDDVDLL